MRVEKGGGWLKREAFEKEMARASPELPDTEGGVVRPTGSNLQALPSSGTKLGDEHVRLHVKAGDECICMTTRDVRSKVTNLAKETPKGERRPFQRLNAGLGPASAVCVDGTVMARRTSTRPWR